MNEFIDALSFYWAGFSDVTQTLIGQIGYTITGREMSGELIHWVFYGALLALMIFLIRLRQNRLRHEIESRQRYG